MRFNRFAIVAMAAISIIGLAACGSSSSSSSGSSGGSGEGNDPYRVFAVEPLSGPFSLFGKACAEALRETEKIVNADGGFDGRPMELVVKDDKGEGTEALTLLQEEINSGNKPDLVIPGTTSDEAVPLLPVLAKEGILSVTNASDTALDNPEKYPLNFGVATTSLTIAGPMIEQLKKEGFKSVAVILTDNELGRSNGEAYEELGSQEGLEVAVAYVPEEAVDATSQLEQLDSHNPEVLVVSAFGPSIVPMLKAKEKLGLEIPTWGDTATASQDLPATVGSAAAQKITLQAQPWQVEGEEPSAAYTKQSKEAFDAFYPRLQKAGIDTVIVPYIFTHDTVALAVAGANKAKSTEAGAIAEAIEGGLTPAETPLFIGTGGWTAEDHFPATTAEKVVEVSAAETNEGLIVGSH